MAEASKAAAQGALAPLAKTTLLAVHAHRSSMPVRPAPPVWHNSLPQLIMLSSMQRSRSMPSPYTSVPTKLNLMNYAALSSRSSLAASTPCPHIITLTPEVNTMSSFIGGMPVSGLDSRDVEMR